MLTLYYASKNDQLLRCTFQQEIDNPTY